MTKTFVEGEFLLRVNRFLTEVKVEGEHYKAFLANSGRLKDILKKGTPVILRKKERGTRNTPFDLWAAWADRTWVIVDARAANLLFPFLLESGLLSLQGHTFPLTSEVKAKGTRLDFSLQKAGQTLWVETKSVTLVKGTQALFPDAPTTRGTKQLRELQRLLQEGHRALLAFMVLRGDATAFSPNWEIDPEFCSSLKETLSNGLEVLAFRFSVQRESVTKAERIPVCL